MRERRSDKRIHSKHLFDAVVPLMRLPAWRERLLKLQHGDRLLVDANALRGERGDFAQIVRHWGLRYVLTIDDSNERNDPCPVPGSKVFRVQAARHPRVYAWIEEPPDALGRT